MSKKPLNRKAYGSIPHLPGSKRGPRDKGVNTGQAAIVLSKPRPGDRIFVEEKIDGSCVAIAKIGGAIVPLNRAGHRAESSPYEQHHLFAKWVLSQWQRWDDLLEEGDRLVGEWCALCHSVRYDFPDRDREPFFVVCKENIMSTQNENLTDCDRDILKGIGDGFGSRLENLPSNRRRDFFWFLHLAIGYLIREVEKMEREFGGPDPDSDDEYNLEWAIVQLGIEWKRDVTDRDPAIEKLLDMLNGLSLPALSGILMFLMEEQGGYRPQEKKPFSRR